jgi:hypothetical protein
MVSPGNGKSIRALTTNATQNTVNAAAASTNRARLSRQAFVPQHQARSATDSRNTSQAPRSRLNRPRGREAVRLTHEDFVHFLMRSRSIIPWRTLGVSTTGESDVTNAFFGGACAITQSIVDIVCVISRGLRPTSTVDIDRSADAGKQNIVE